MPVSSSGHLVLAGYFLGLSESHLLFNVIVHVATLLATVLFYRQTLVGMGREFLVELRSPGFVGRLYSGFQQAPDLRLLWLIVLGSLPTAFIGLVFKDSFEALFQQPKQAALMLLVTAVMLLATRWARSTRCDSPCDMTIWYALLIGVVQGMAIVPGISRSGATIACALLLGVERELAARFSFLLAIPAISGALLLELRDVGMATALPAATMGVGFVTAAMVGLLALMLLIPLVRQGRLYYFAFYLIPTGVMGWLLLP